MIILSYQYYESTTTVGVFSSEAEAQKAVQEFLDAYKEQELWVTQIWDDTDEETLKDYRKRFRLIPAELNQIVDRSVGFVYDWLWLGLLAYCI